MTKFQSNNEKRLKSTNLFTTKELHVDGSRAKLQVRKGWIPDAAGEGCTHRITLLNYGQGHIGTIGAYEGKIN